jgi:endoglucanase
MSDGSRGRALIEDSILASVAQQVPLVVGEMGEHDCAYGYIDRLMPWLDRHGVSYLAWAWNRWDCAGGPALITDFSGTPTTFGLGLQQHLGQLFWSNLVTTVECAPISFTSCR